MSEAEATEKDVTRTEESEKDSHDWFEEPLEWYLERVTLAVLIAIVAFVAYGFYENTHAAIEVWASEEFAPVYRAVFNLVVLLLATAGTVRLLRRVKRARE